MCFGEGKFCGFPDRWRLMALRVLPSVARAWSEEPCGEDAGGAGVLRAVELGYAHGSADVDFAGGDGDGFDLLVRQAGGCVEVIELSGVPVEYATVAGADPEVAIVAGERGDGEVGEGASGRG